MQLTDRITAFSELGKLFANYCEFAKSNESTTNEWMNKLDAVVTNAKHHNGWFTEENLLFSLDSWAKQLTKEKLTSWMNAYGLSNNTPKNVGIIMAGNIPLVGFHDFLSVLISGHSVLVKQSSNDKHLLPFLAKYLEFVEEDFKGKISFTEEKLTNFDAVIATGSNNTARYFEYYFKNKPSIIRKSRNSIAVITNKVTDEDFANLADDVFQYFGLGCRSVSKLYVPKGFNFDAFFNGMYSKKDIINNAKYANNYDYNKAVYLMSEFDLLENGFLMIKEDESYSSPIATVFYEYYDNEIDLKIKLHQDKDKIQCIVAKDFLENEVAFGQTQHPALTDYADGVNTLEFLSKI